MVSITAQYMLLLNFNVGNYCRLRDLHGPPRGYQPRVLALQHPVAGVLSEEKMPFADTLLSSLGRGATSCAELQQSALAMALEAGWEHCSSVTRTIAKLGCYGKFPGNVERDLFNALSLPVEPWYQLLV